VFSARLTTDKTRRELITGQLDPNKQRSREQSLHPFFNHDASGDIFAGIDFTADACCSTDNGDRWTVIHNALTTSNVTNALTVSRNRAVFGGNLRRWGFFVLPIGTTSSSQHAVFVLSLAAKPSGDIFVGRTSAAVFSAQRMISNTWCRENNGLIATDVRAIAINPSNTVFAGTYELAFFEQVIAPRFGRRSIRVC
jgi:hypothetical protein